MSEEEINIAVTILKMIVLPVLGFAAGFLTKWFLQAKKSRDELLRELSPKRVEKLTDLWELTMPFAKSPQEQSILERRIESDTKFREWYFTKSGALFLSWEGTKRYFNAIDTLRDVDSSPIQLKEKFSRLRSELKHDCGIYTRWNRNKQLTAPREPLETANKADQQ